MKKGNGPKQGGAARGAAPKAGSGVDAVATDSDAPLDGKAMMDSIFFQRSDIPPEYTARGVWMLKVIRFMRLRGWLSNKWLSLSTGVLEGRVLLPEPLKDVTFQSLSLSKGMKDSYHAAAVCKKTFDKFMSSLMKIVKPRVTKEFATWEEWKEKLDLAAYSKANAVNADVAELDALHSAIIYQPLKEKDRTERKSKENYHGHIDGVKDIVRGSIVCENDKDIASVLKTIREITNVYTPIDLEEYRRKRKGAPARLSLAPRGLAVKKIGSKGSVSSREKSGWGDIEGWRPGSSDSVGSEQSTASASTATPSVAVAGQYEEAKKQRDREICLGMRVVSCTNRFKLPAAHGYRDVLIIFAIDYVHEVEADPGSSHTNAEPHLEVCQCLCELQIHHADLLDFANSMNSWDFYAYFRTFFGKSAAVSGAGPAALAGSTSIVGPRSLSNDTPQAFQNKLKALKTMDQVGEFVEQLEAAMEVYLGGVGRVGRDLPRLSAYFQLFARVGEQELAEAMQTSLIRQLRDQGRAQELYQELSKLSQYFKTLKRYKHAKPLSEEALALCEQLMGPVHMETAMQLTNHANLLHCCDNLEDALPLFDRALGLKQKLLGELNPISYKALDHLASVHYDSGNFLLAESLYKEVLEVHRKIARQSRTGQSGPEVAKALMNLASIYEVDPTLRDFDRCYSLYAEILTIYEDFYGREHLTRAECLEAVANLKDQEGLLAEALEGHREALNLRIRLFSASSAYMGFSENDEKNNPPWAVLADSYNSVGELLLDLGEVEEAISALREGLRIRTILNEPHNHHLSSGSENAAMALASVQTNLSMAIIQGEKRAHHHQSYFEARDIVKPAYATRMKYLGIRAIQTEQTINVQGLVDELIKDYASEKEKIKLDKKYKKEKEEKNAAKLAAKLAAFHVAAGTKPLPVQDNINAMAGAAAKGPNGNATAANVNGVTTINTSATVVKKAPAPLKIGQKVSIETMNQQEEVIEVQEVVEEVDELHGHVHTRGINDIGARQQLDAPLAKAHELLEMVERLRDLGEHDSALKCSYEALAHLRPDLYALPDSLSLAGSSSQVSLDEKVKPLVISKEMACSTRGPERKLAFAVALSYLGTAQMDKGWHNHAVLSFQQSLDLIIQTYGDSYIHRDIAQGLSSLATALRCDGHSEDAMEVGLQARTQWVALIRKDSETETRIKDEEKALIEGKERDQDEGGISPQKGGGSVMSGLPDPSIAGLQAGGSIVGSFGGSNLSLVEDFNEERGVESAEVKEGDVNKEEKAKDPMDDPHWYNPKHPEAFQVTKLDHMLTLCLTSLGHYDEADERCHECLVSIRTNCGTDVHPDVIAVLNTQGLVKAHMGDYEASFDLYNDILKLRSRVYGTSDPAFAAGINNYAAAMFMVDDMAYAGRTWTESLELRERQVAVGSYAMITALHNMAALFWRQENEVEAVPFENGKEIIREYLFSQFGEPPITPVVVP